MKECWDCYYSEADIAYLIQEGQYNENQKNVRINKISKLLSCPKERTTKILYYMEKEKI